MIQIQVDTREHAAEWERISKQFDALGVSYFRSKLYVGDYCLVDSPRVVVDRKKDLNEICSNICQQHERFKAELLRAEAAGFKIIILCEHGRAIRSLEDVFFWENPRRKKSPKATNGPQLYKALSTIRERYGVEFVFCEKHQTGKKIVEVLSEWQRKDS